LFKTTGCADLIGITPFNKKTYSSHTSNGGRSTHQNVRIGHHASASTSPAETSAGGLSLPRRPFANVPFQKLIYIPLQRRTPFHIILKLTGTVSHTKHARLTTIPLPDADFFIQLLKKPLFLQHLQCRDQIPVAGTAGSASSTTFLDTGIL